MAGTSVGDSVVSVNDCCGMMQRHHRRVEAGGGWRMLCRRPHGGGNGGDHRALRPVRPAAEGRRGRRGAEAAEWRTVGTEPFSAREAVGGSGGRADARVSRGGSIARQGSRDPSLTPRLMVRAGAGRGRAAAAQPLRLVPACRFTERGPVLPRTGPPFRSSPALAPSIAHAGPLHLLQLHATSRVTRPEDPCGGPAPLALDLLSTH